MTKRELMMLIGKNLHKFRQESSLTQEQLAEKAMISTSFYASLEGGKKSMSMLVLRRLADALEVSIDFLLRDDSADTHTKNICVMLQNQPLEIVHSVEKIVRVCLQELSCKNHS